jgi:peptidoglycan hydrolase-like protein with peptidoglycan-binding domain
MRRIIVAVLCVGVGVVPATLVTAGASAAATAPSSTTVASWPVVKPGARGERVRVIQNLLNARGARVTVDGLFGATTTRAVKNFQGRKGLAVDGQVGPATWRKLIITISRGASGPAVTALQHQLRFQYGYRAVTVDGKFGAATQTAVKSFQTKKGLRADGIVGSATWQALES